MIKSDKYIYTCHRNIIGSNNNNNSQISPRNIQIYKLQYKVREQINIRYSHYTNMYVKLIRALFIKLSAKVPRQELTFFLSKNRAKKTFIIWNQPVGCEVESDDDREVGLGFGGKIGSRYGRSVSKDVKGGVDVIIDDRVDSGVDRIFDYEVFRCVDLEVNILVIWVLYMDHLKDIEM